MRKMKTALAITLLLTSSLLFIKKAEASLGEAKVYIICLNGVPGHWVDNCTRVKDGVIDACMLKGKYIEGNMPRAHPKRSVDYPPYYDATAYVVTSWSQYEIIVKSYSGVIVVNTHGEYLPIPSDYHNNKTGWVDEIASSMLKRRQTWVHVGGYPFYRVWYQQTETGEEWTEEVDDMTIGAGFRQLMNHINKDNVHCWPPDGWEDEWATMQLGDQQIGLSWYFNQSSQVKGPITEIHYATLGRPLKIDDFKEHLILPLFRYPDYYAGAVIAFVKAGARYITGCGAGAYVHIGARRFYDIDGIELDADFVRGFIGTAAALWAECMGFKAELDAKQSTAPVSENATLLVQPSVSGIHVSGDDLIVAINLDIYGVTQGYESAGVFDFECVYFIIDEVLGSVWSDVTMRVDLGYSREAYGDGLMLSGLYDEDHAVFGLLVSGAMWMLGGPEVLAGDSIAKFILFGMGGIKLLAQWINQGCSMSVSGVNTFDPYIEFKYIPKQTYTRSDGKMYWAFMTFTRVELKIPMSGKPAGWQILPLSYRIKAMPNWYWGTPGWLETSNTLEIAIWFDGGGQKDAGIEGDAGDDYSSARAIYFPGSYHGYIDGADAVDCYMSSVLSTQKVVVSMTPPPYVNFDLEVQTLGAPLTDRRTDQEQPTRSHLL